jgi:hypothetical protein
VSWGSSQAGLTDDLRGFKRSTALSPLTLNPSPRSGEREATSQVARRFAHLAILRARCGGQKSFVCCEPFEATPSPLNGERAGVRGENVVIRENPLNYPHTSRRQLQLNEPFRKGS